MLKHLEEFHLQNKACLENAYENILNIYIYIVPTVYNKLIPFNYTIILVIVYNVQTLEGISFALQFPSIISQLIQ